jgi:protein O-GlcNAc transferase
MNAAERLHAKAERELREGRAEAAFALGQRLVEKFPRFAPGFDLLGVLHQRRRRYEPAVACLRQAVELRPADARLHNNLAVALREAGRGEESLAACDRALAIEPDYDKAHNNRGLALLTLARIDEAEAAFRAAVARAPRYVKAHNNLGTALLQQGRPADAVAAFREAVRLDPIYASALNGLGAALRDTGALDEAVAVLRQALKLRPRYAKAAFHLGTTLIELGRIGDARDALRLALACEPGYPRALAALGSLLLAERRPDEAAELAREAVRADAESVEARLQLAAALHQGQRCHESASLGADILVHAPERNDARARRLECAAEICDWRDRDEDVARLLDAMRARLADGGVLPVNVSLAHRVLPCSAEEQLAVAGRQAHELVRRMDDRRRALAFTDDGARYDRLRVGYFSCDFRDHATGHLMRGLFGLHDRERFEVHAYSFGPDDGSDYRHRIAADCDRFVDLRGLGTEDAARRIHAEGVHILVDLVGWAAGWLEVLALRPAPVQAHYLGFPATLGAPFVDYFVTDRVVTPPELAPHFSEQLAYLPGSYQVNDHRQGIAESGVTREACGLPPKAVVFCCFNAAYKIEPRVFDVWMRLLRRAEKSVLWLLDQGTPMRENLRHEAESRGVDPRRLVFAPLAPKPYHLARATLADLFLDTLVCNAHTTASDSLWAGVPVLTLPGETFASRVAASLVTAVGLPEMIVGDLDAYEERAFGLASDGAALAGLKARLGEGRARAPLFDTPRFARGLESAYEAMWRGGQRALPGAARR